MPRPTQIDPRGQRFAAGLTAVVLATVLLTGSVWLLAAQAVVFATGAFVGPHRTPYAAVFRRFVRPRLAPPSHLEAVEPPQFAQLVGLLFAGVGVLGLASGATLVGQVAVALALAAAFLNAAFGFCLGCEVYLLGRRVVGSRSPARQVEAAGSTTTSRAVHTSTARATATAAATPASAVLTDRSTSRADKEIPA